MRSARPPTSSPCSSATVSAARDLGPWLADATVAGRLGWPRAVLVLGAYPPPPTASDRLSPADGRQAQPVSSQRIFAAYARAALQAVDLAAELDRRAERLIAVAPKLRGKRCGRDDRDASRR
ncbi:DUF1403 family protein [Mesorhizobium sp. M1312]|uniref:DUF1403 family protein n=1 Tax=unclassified Mesorhizobium TaxID=325217 RepID=UPI0033362896